MNMSVLQVCAVGEDSGNMAGAVYVFGERGVRRKRVVGRGCVSVVVSLCWLVGDA